MRKWLVVAALLALVAAMASTTPGDVTRLARAQGSYRYYYPMMVFAAPPQPVKGVAGWVRSPVLPGVSWTYQWNTMYGAPCGPYPAAGCEVSAPYELVNSVRSTKTRIVETWQCPKGAAVHPPPDPLGCLADYARARPGAYWLIWNEPDWPWPPNSDDISPQLAATYWPLIRGAIHGADPSARLIVGNVLRTEWLDEFTGLVGLDGIEGFGVHAYGSIAGPGCARSNDGCLLRALGTRLAELRAWGNQYAGRELWLTEFNILPDTFDQAQIARTMPQMCAMIRAHAFTRFAYFSGGSYAPAAAASVANPDGHLAGIYEGC